MEQQELETSVASVRPSVGPLPDVTTLRAVVVTEFPELWPAVDAGLSTAATLLLEDNANPVSVIYIGGPSSSKTTVAEMFATCPIAYVSDNFTPASFVSHAANVSRNQLNSVDLLPRIRHKLLITPELAPIFRGKDDELTKRFAILTRVLDGKGLMTDSGTHGQRGYRGDYLFAWLGCTTPFESKVWRLMAQLGSRLFFYEMGDRPDCSIEDLMHQSNDYAEKLDRCSRAVGTFLTDLFAYHGGVRGLPWNADVETEEEVLRWVAWMATLLAAMRSEPVHEGDPKRGNLGYSPARDENPRRANAVLRNLARGHAVVHGRTFLNMEDVPVVVKVTLSTIPSEFRRLFKALVAKQGDPLTVAEGKKALGVQHRETVRHLFGALARRGIAHYRTAGVGKSGSLEFRSDWAWCASPSHAGFFIETGTEPVTKWGV